MRNCYQRAANTRSSIAGSGIVAQPTCLTDRESVQGRSAAGSARGTTRTAGRAVSSGGCRAVRSDKDTSQFLVVRRRSGRVRRPRQCDGGRHTEHVRLRAHLPGASAQTERDQQRRGAVLLRDASGRDRFRPSPLPLPPGPAPCPPWRLCGHRTAGIPSVCAKASVSGQAGASSGTSASNRHRKASTVSASRRNTAATAA